MESLPLKGITVVDLTRHRAGPVTSRILADWGADVVKVEEPIDKGDGMGGSREGFDYQNLNRNKKSLTVNLKTQQGQNIFRRLVEKADIVLENFRPEVKYRLGLDYETLRSVNKQIICGSISGFGQTGPYSKRPAVDQIIQGVSGLMSVTGTKNAGPLRVGAAVADVSAGMTLAHAVLLALYHREKTKRGQWVYTSLLESTFALMDFQVARWLANGEVPVFSGNDHPTLMPTGIVRTRDGVITIAAAEDDKFKLLCRILGISEICSMPEYADIEARSNNRKQLMHEIQKVASKFTSNDLIDLLNEAGIPSGPIYDIGEAMCDEQVEHLNVKCTVEHPELGRMALLGQPMHLEGCPSANVVRTPAPMHGQHTRSILVEMLGFSEQEVDSFHTENVI